MGQEGEADWEQCAGQALCAIGPRQEGNPCCGDQSVQSTTKESLPPLAKMPCLQPNNDQMKLMMWSRIQMNETRKAI